MRYDDEQRPRSANSALEHPLQINGSPLPAITLIRPMELEDSDGMWHWGWLASIHAHKGTNRFGTYYAQIASFDEFSEAFIEDPEGALLRWFKYEGPERTATPNGVRKQSVDVDLWGD